MKLRDVYKYFDSPASAVSYFFVDRLAAPIVWVNVNFLKIHPNVISAISGVLAVLTVFEFFKGDYVLGAVLYLLTFLFDSVDGPSARAMEKKTLLGVVLEVWFDSIRLVGSSFAISWNLYAKSGNDFWMLLFLVWGISFGAGVWLYPKAKESFKEDVYDVSKEKYTVAKFVTWMDFEMLEFFFAPIFGFVRAGYIILVVGYFITTLGMSVYMAFLNQINRLFNYIKDRKRKEKNG